MGTGIYADGTIRSTHAWKRINTTRRSLRENEWNEEKNPSDPNLVQVCSRSKHLLGGNRGCKTIFGESNKSCGIPSLETEVAQIVECLCPLRLFRSIDKEVVLDDATVWQFVVPKKHDASKKKLGKARKAIEYCEREKKALTVFGTRGDTQSREEVVIVPEGDDEPIETTSHQSIISAADDLPCNMDDMMVILGSDMNCESNENVDAVPVHTPLKTAKEQQEASKKW